MYRRLLAARQLCMARMSVRQITPMQSVDQQAPGDTYVDNSW